MKASKGRRINSNGTILVNQATRAWKLAAKLLGIEVVAPFSLRAGRKLADCIAFLPHFGSSQGMVIGTALPPDFTTDSTLIECAQERGLFYSFINPEAYATYDETHFKDTLKDWGFFGPPQSRPVWFV